MSSGSYRQKDVRCPFYKSDDGKQRIVCEGFGEALNLTQVYTYKKDYLKQMEVFCCRNYKNCEVHRVIMETKYEEE